MDSSSVYGDDDHPLPHLKNVLLENESHVTTCTSQDLDSLWLQDSSTPSFHGSASTMVNFEDDNTATKKPTFQKINNNAAKIRNSEELILDAFSQKKRRLSSDQVRYLDKSFEVDNKLEPERKVQLAKELGLQPRQVAIWFQNRRARYKTKLLEKDYDVLKSNYDKLKEDYDALYSQNEKLKTELNMLTEKLLVKGNEDQPKKKEQPLDDVKQSNTSLAKSEVLDSDTDGNHSSTVLELEPGTVSDYEEDDSLSKSLLLQADSCFPKLEMECCDDLQPNSNCNLGFPVQNHGTWFWQV